MSEADVATILRSVLRFIAQCHTKGIIYRDVKPDNFLFLTSDATTVKATDFGLSIRCLITAAYRLHREQPNIYIMWRCSLLSFSWTAFWQIISQCWASSVHPSGVACCTTSVSATALTCSK